MPEQTVVEDRTTASTRWGLTSKRIRKDTTAHAWTPQGSGWKSACGRFLPTLPLEAPDGHTRCGMCDRMMTNTWRIPTVIPKVAQRAR